MSLKRHNRQLAIPVKDNLLSERLFDCNFCMVYKGDKASTLKAIPYSTTNVERLVEWAVDSGITDIAVHSIDHQTIELFANTKINLFVGLPMVKPELLIEAFLNGSLKSDPNFIKP